jgi:hypothetical protein
MPGRPLKGNMILNSLSFYQFILAESLQQSKGRCGMISHGAKCRTEYVVLSPHLALNLTVILFFFFSVFPAWAADFDIESKRPLSALQELRVSQDEQSIKVSGETFVYTFNKSNGLIGAIEVLGREMTGGCPIPDLSMAENLDPEFSPFTARHETQARVTLVKTTPARVVIEAEGSYTARDGQRSPLRYILNYDLSIDGVILVHLANNATGPCTIRWLRLSAGAVRQDMAKFLNWMPEQSTSQSTQFQFRVLQGNETGTIISGVWIPWIWIGDQDAGLEVTTWDVSSQTYNQVDSTARNDESAMFVVRQGKGQVQWENFLIRRTRVDADAGWSRSGSFALAVTPSKKIDHYYSLIKGAHLGPHQHLAQLELPGEQEIRTLAQNGYNLVVGMANWRSGEYVPLNEASLQRTIALCHKYGVKIIPYITLVDLAHSTDAFRRYGEQWAIEPTTEFIHHLRPADLNAELGFRNDPEEETTLMCPGAEGWRTHWKRQIDRIIQTYDFDGIYFDFWYGRMVCENSRHGCGGRFRRGTVLGSREMLMYAYNRLKAKNPRAIIKANTNTLATALITSLVDIRLVGEAIDAAGMDEDSRRWLHSSCRLGETTEFLWDQTRLNALQKASFASLVNFLPQWYERPAFVPRTSFDDFDVFRSFDDGTGNWHLGLSHTEKLKFSPLEVKINTVEKEGSILLTALNTSPSASTAQIPLQEDWLACDPLSGQLPALTKGILRANLDGGEYRHFLLFQPTHDPQLLYTLGARLPATSTYNSATRKLRITADAVEGARLRIGVYTPLPILKVASSRTGQIPFTRVPREPLLNFEAVYTAGDLFEISFQ